MSLGKGLITGVSKKQKINTRSSTEAELVGADDMLPQIMWKRYFIEAQGFNVDKSILYQDNLSAMILEKNGKQSNASGRNISGCAISLSRTGSEMATYR
jgi:hypothetical protein